MVHYNVTDGISKILHEIFVIMLKFLHQQLTLRRQDEFGMPKCGSSRGSKPQQTAGL